MQHSGNFLDQVSAQASQRHLPPADYCNFSHDCNAFATQRAKSKEQDSKKVFGERVRPNRRVRQLSDKESRRWWHRSGVWSPPTDRHNEGRCPRRRAEASLPSSSSRFWVWSKMENELLRLVTLRYLRQFVTRFVCCLIISSFFSSFFSWTLSAEVLRVGSGIGLWYYITDVTWICTFWMFYVGIGYGARDQWPPESVDFERFMSAKGMGPIVIVSVTLVWIVIF